MPNDSYSFDKNDLKEGIQYALDNNDVDAASTLSETLADWEELEKQEVQEKIVDI